MKWAFVYACETLSPQIGAPSSIYGISNRHAHALSARHPHAFGVEINTRMYSVGERHLDRAVDILSTQHTHTHCQLFRRLSILPDRRARRLAGRARCAPSPYVINMYKQLAEMGLPSDCSVMAREPEHNATHWLRHETGAGAEPVHELMMVYRTLWRSRAAWRDID